MCKHCETETVITLSNGSKLCRGCFIKYFEKKVLKTIQRFNLIQRDDKLIVALSGGKDSTSVLYLMHKIGLKRNWKEVEALTIDEGIGDYRLKTIENAKRLCKEQGIKLHVVSYKEEFGMNVNEMVKKLKADNPCSVCGVLRRCLLNKYARKLGGTKLVTGHNLDDEAQAIIMNQFKQNFEMAARLGPMAGVVRSNSFVPRIKPFYLLTEDEVRLYASLMGFVTKKDVCPYAKGCFRNEVKQMLDNFEEKYKGTKYCVVNYFLNTMPLLKESVLSSGKDISHCKKCGEPCSKDVCKVCELVEKLGK
jgi:uncharacterized protein (TIGR00269 family)